MRSKVRDLIRSITNLSDCSWTRTHNHLVRKRTLNHDKNIQSITNNSYHYDEKYMKIKFKLDDKLLLNKAMKLCNAIVVVSY